MAEKGEEFYKNLEVDLYDNLIASSKNPIRRYFHRSRTQMISQAVKTHYKKGMKVLDLGCGTSNWNIESVPSTGVDVNQEMLDYALKKKRIKNAIKSKIQDLDEKRHKADVVVMADILEHLENPGQIIKKVRKLLKPDGVLILNLPYDTPLSLWMPLYALQCFLEGTIRGKQYWKDKGGHINHFSPKKTSKMLKDNGFKVISQKSNYRLNFITIARKQKKKKRRPYHEWDEFWKEKSITNKVIDFARVRYYNRCLADILLQKTDKNTDLMEIGCGTSSLLLTLSEEVKSLTGMDVSENALRISMKKADEAGIKNISFINDDFIYTKKKKQYDIIWSQGLIEHFEDSKKAVEKHLSFTKNGGYTMISVPSKYSLFYIWYTLSKMLCLRRMWPWPEQKFFTKGEMEDIVESIKSGFQYKVYYIRPFILGLVITEIHKKKIK